jgi:uncharacterized glyoxalase superfamily protein PhnB
MPPGIVIPVLHYPDVRAAVDWLSRAFQFREHLRIADHRSQMVVNDEASIIVAQGRPDEIPEGFTMMVKVYDINFHYQIALYHGAEPFGEPQTFPYGERQYTVKDLAGHQWTFSQTVEDVDPLTWGGAIVEEPFWK